MRQRRKNVRWAMAGVAALSAAFAVVAFVGAHVRLTAPVPGTRNLLVTPALRPPGAALPESAEPTLFCPATIELTLPTLEVPPVHYVESCLGAPTATPVGTAVPFPEDAAANHEDTLRTAEFIGVGPTLHVPPSTSLLGAPTVAPGAPHTVADNPALFARGAGVVPWQGTAVHPDRPRWLPDPGELARAAARTAPPPAATAPMSWLDVHTGPAPGAIRPGGMPDFATPARRPRIYSIIDRLFGPSRP